MVDRQGNLIGATVIDSAGQALGTVSALLIDPHSLQGKWLKVELAELPVRRAVVPLAAVSVDPSGLMVLPWTAGMVAGAPPIGDQVTVEQARALRAYYQLDL